MLHDDHSAPDDVNMYGRPLGRRTSAGRACDHNMSEVREELKDTLASGDAVSWWMRTASTYGIKLDR
jgi:hypothetical protein